MVSASAFALLPLCVHGVSVPRLPTAVTAGRISRARLFLVGRVCVFDQDNKEVYPESSFLTMQRPIPHTERSF